MASSNVTAALAPKPFLWGSDGKQLSPEEAAARRAAADRLRAPEGYTPEGFMTLLGALAGEGVGQVKENEAVAAETSGRASVLDALNKARETGDYMSVMSDPWVTPQQSSVAGALQGRAWSKEDQAAQWAREDARAAQARAASAAEGARPKYKTIEVGGDVYRYNENDPNSTPEMFFDGPEAPGYRPMTAEEKAAYGLPPESAAQIGPDNKVDPIGGSGQTINVNTADGADADFYKAGAKVRGEQFAGMETAGIEAQSRIGQINRLEGLLANSPQGAEGAIKQLAGEIGIATEGLDNIQSAQALINKMVPTQRQPGSGTMSDADLALFKASLPRIVNQPGGNATIIETLKGVAVYEQKLGDIASKVLNREISPADGREMMKAVPNPLEMFRGGDAAAAGGPPDGVDAATWSAMTPQERALWN